jgi:hypothetical protein
MQLDWRLPSLSEDEFLKVNGVARSEPLTPHLCGVAKACERLNAGLHRAGRDEQVGVTGGSQRWLGICAHSKRDAFQRRRDAVAIGERLQDGAQLTPLDTVSHKRDAVVMLEIAGHLGRKRCKQPGLRQMLEDQGRQALSLRRLTQRQPLRIGKAFTFFEQFAARQYIKLAMAAAPQKVVEPR